MALMETDRLSLPLLAAGQAQKHVTHNEALLILDALVFLAVERADLSVPPATVADGARYIVDTGASGAWAGREGAIAVSEGGTWTFLTPREGWRAWDRNGAALLVFHDNVWTPLGGSEQVARLGINATADDQNRLSLSSPASLFNHAGAGHQIKINKNMAADTASLLYQTGFSGRAEIGLAGNDALEFKISADGSAWNTALVALPTGQVGIGGVTPTATLHAAGPVRIGTFTVATLPSASAIGAGGLIHVSNAAGGAVIAFSDGTSWRRISDRTLVT